ncbi:MAG TPA: sulfatase-like hydrolase/transferase, partial [Vicinamibacteria bacterium]|nr:sulfatase-like hydrolase/transferase [Vicinamibacteria bacterium]
STPVLDALAARGVRFATAVAHVPLTGPSHASILSGLGPLGHGFRENAGFVLPAQVKSGPQDLHDAGYRTAAFVSAFPLDRRFGFDRGFDVYDDHLPKGNDTRRTPYVERFADATTDAVLRWLETPAEGAARPFFLWVHYYDPHAPYEPPGEFATRFRAAPYDGEVAFADQQLGRLLDALQQRALLARTLVVAMSDHGEGLGEHGEGTHGMFVYDSTLKVPFIVAGPGVAAGRVAPTVARAVDVLPTLLDYTGLKLRPELEGRSLRPAIEGREMDDAPAYAETLYPQREFGWAPLFAWRTARHKAIEAPRPELYDLQRDPGETDNLAPRDTTRLAEMRQTLETARRQEPPSAGAEVDPEAAEMLRALGYVAKAGGQQVVAGASLRDPKDGQRLVPRLNRGMSIVRTDPATAIRELKSVLAEDPGLLVARRSLAVAYTSARQYDRAIAELRRLEKEGVLTAEDGVVLGDNLRFAGRLDEATVVLERTARDNPRFAQPWLSLAEVHVKREELAEAATAYEHALQITPDHVEALRGLGDLALLRQQLDEASRRYARILEIEPADAGAMTKLGVVRMRSGRPDEATALFRRAIEREPKNGEALLYLAGALASTGHPAEAIPYFERALDAGQRNPMALNGLALTRLELGDRKGAEQAFRESLKLDPKQPDVARTLAEIGNGGRSD